MHRQLFPKSLHSERCVCKMVIKSHTTPVKLFVLLSEFGQFRPIKEEPPDLILSPSNLAQHQTGSQPTR